MSFIIVFISSVIISIFVHTTQDEIINIESLVGVSGYPEPTPQIQNERNWTNISLHELFLLGDTQYDRLWNPVKIDFDRNNNLYLFDWGSYEIKKYAPDGSYLFSFGKGKGRGPGEFVNPTDFTVTNTGRVLVVDPPVGRVTVFENSGEIINTINITDPYLLRIASVNDSLFIIFKMDERLFSLYDISGIFHTSFGDLIPDQLVNGLALDGWVVGYDDKNIIYAFQRAGYFASFSIDGQLNYFSRTIDDIPLPNMHIIDGGRRLDPRAKVTTRSISVYGEYLYLFDLNQSRLQDKGVVDVYNANTGEYEYSFSIPNNVSRAYIHDKYVYAISDTLVVSWSMQ